MDALGHSSETTRRRIHRLPIVQARQGKTSDNALKRGLKILPADQLGSHPAELQRLEPGEGGMGRGWAAESLEIWKASLRFNGP